jgi:hypothetical protein
MYMNKRLKKLGVTSTNIAKNVYSNIYSDAKLTPVTSPSMNFNSTNPSFNMLRNSKTKNYLNTSSDIQPNGDASTSGINLSATNGINMVNSYIRATEKTETSDELFTAN